MKGIASSIWLLLVLFISPTASLAEEMTRLRADPPAGEFVTSRGATRLRKVDVNVRNVGETVAQNVKVRIQLPNGSNEEAYGPNSLEPKSEATYSLYPNDYVLSDNRLKAEVSCRNCFK